MKIVIDVSEKLYNQLLELKEYGVAYDNYQEIIMSGKVIEDNYIDFPTGTLKKVQGNYRLYDRDWLKKHINMEVALLRDCEEIKNDKTRSNKSNKYSP